MLIIVYFTDGIKDKDKDTFGTTLQNVATLNPRDNKYYLSKHLYSEVSLDWPFYNDGDKDIVKRWVLSFNLVSCWKVGIMF